MSKLQTKIALFIGLGLGALLAGRQGRRMESENHPDVQWTG